METNLQHKIHELLLTLSGISDENLFYNVADPDDEKVFPRIIYSQLSDPKNYDTEQEFARVAVQISLFDVNDPDQVDALKSLALDIQDLFTLSNLAGTVNNMVTRVKLDSTRESVYQNIFQIDLSFFLDISRQYG